MSNAGRMKLSRCDSAPARRPLFNGLVRGSHENYIVEEILVAKTHPLDNPAVTSSPSSVSSSFYFFTLLVQPRYACLTVKIGCLTSIRGPE